MLDYYNLLQAPPEASAKALRAAFRREAKQFHPDAHPHAPPAEREARQRRFILLAQAYDTLSDAARRREYDRQWRREFPPGSADGRAAGQARSSRRQGPRRAPESAAPDWNDLLRDVDLLLARFGLDLRQPLERLLEALLEWALALFREVAGAGRASGGSSREAAPGARARGGRSEPGPAGETKRSSPSARGSAARRPGRGVDPDAIERELAELKRRAGHED